MSSSKASTWNVAELAFALLLAASTGLIVASPRVSAAQESEVAIGAKGGGNWSLLDRPHDPAGEPTLMNGAAFSGVGPTAGAAVQFGLGRLAGQPLALELDVLYARHHARGAERHPETGARRTIILKTDGLRVPLLMEWYLPATNRSTFVGLGPELWVGLRAGSEMQRTNIDAPPEHLRTTTVVHPLVAATVGYEFELGSPDLVLPVELRAKWDPLVAETTVGRFEGFQSPEEPGRYRVAFDWQLTLLAGLLWRGL